MIVSKKKSELKEHCFDLYTEDGKCITFKPLRDGNGKWKLVGEEAPVKDASE